MTRIRNAMFLVLLVVTFSVRFASAHQTLSFYDDFKAFYGCSGDEYQGGYMLTCGQNCYQNPYFDWDAEDACADYCGGPGEVRNVTSIDCWTACECEPV